jgi:drug/metabolite transporter (DMT)-like permease
VCKEINLVSYDVLAVILGTIANSIYNIGLVLKKKGACTLPDIEENSVWQNIKNFSQCKIWVIGFSMTIFQWFILTAANMIGSLSLVAPTMGIGMIVLVIFSWFYLKEKIRPAEIIGIIAIISATVALNVVGPTSPGKYSLEETNIFFAETNAIIFMCVYAVIIATLILIAYGRKHKTAGPFLAIASGAGYAMATIFAKAAFGSLNFTSGSHFLTDSLKSWEWWIYLILMCGGYLVAFTAQQMALQKGKAIVVSPTLDEINLFTQVMAGVIIFNDWETLGLLPWQKTVKSIAIIVIMVGVALLSFYSAIEESIKERINGKKEDAKEHIILDVEANEIEAIEPTPIDVEAVNTDTTASENTIRFK